MRTGGSVLRKFNTTEYIDMLCTLVDGGAKCALPVSGCSMSPFLAGGRDSVCIEAPHGGIKRGDIVLYRRASGQYVLHRCLRVLPDGSFDAVGDAQTEVERAIPGESVCAVACSAVRRGREISAGSPVWEFFRVWWLLLLPVRCALLRLCGLLRRRKDGKE